ncbi:regulator of telomere elongation helicase 1 [Babesia microti strain RI]|uniref:Regulator of telomere elongation helicase 1 n=1 Tax=Babesia microti (strain RI) TaxID=1133968 RepID=I7JD13_BABMR|nr:regulator of telomere elongation helicase 1 [Babesia microti strain RI]CCF75555.1 regulator of telomere elongation helicase 1 [Babesia microti strain RI]|eukprot:XP_012649963.1 regulator of telomere elongation helicase 1 [Babesia microti strain RI]
MEKNVVSVLGIDVQFPYKIYEPQKLLIEAIIRSIEYGQNALIESPTGTGKTLCLLCASLAYLCDKRIPGLKIIYTTRTHGQLNHFINEFKKVPYYDRLREIGINATILGSRDKLCIHSQCSKMKGNALDGYCKALVHTRTCTYYNGYRSKEYNNLNILMDVMDVEDLTSMGKKYGFCPFYVMREAHKTSNFILMPYNYLFCQTIRDSIELDLNDAIIIIDEAHNIDDFAERVMSFNIYQMDVIRSIDFLKRIITTVNEDMYNKEKDDNPYLNKLLSLYATLQRLDCFLSSLDLDNNRMMHKIKRVDFHYTVGKVGDDFVIFDTISILNTLTSAILDKNSQNSLEQEFGCLTFIMATKISDESFNKNVNIEIQSIDRLKNSLLQLTSQWLRANCQHFYAVLRIDTGNNNNKFMYRSLLFECMNASCTFTKLKNEKIRNLILTSGTLSPIDNFISNISGGYIKFPIVLENEHIISSDRVWVGCISSKLKIFRERFRDKVGNFEDQQLISTYSTRSSHEYIVKLGILLKLFVKSVPGGILCFFPSYTNMNETIEVWKNTGIYHNLYSYKLIFIEVVKSTDSNDSIDDNLNSFKNVVDSGRGALFFAVFRGKIAEGVDFPNDYCRGIFICGIPYPNPHDFRVSLKMNYIRNTQNNSTDVVNALRDGTYNWHVLSAIKAVNQAMGRCIRHADDYGAILLADVRYEYKNIQVQLSKWVLKSLEIFSDTVALSNSLDKFFLKFRKSTKNDTINPIYDISTAKLVGNTESDDESFTEFVKHTCDYQNLLVRFQGKSQKRERSNSSASSLLGMVNDESKMSKSGVDNPFICWSNVTSARPLDQFNLE